MTDHDKPTPGNIDDEVSFHLEMRARELSDQGLDPEQARQEAQRRFGDEKRVKSDCARIDDISARSSRRGELLGEIRQDVTHGLRRLIKAPTFSLLAILILALGIGANTAIFSVLNAVVLRPLPYPEPDRMVQVWESSPSRGWDFFAMSELNYVDYRAATDSFDQLAALGFGSFNLGGNGEIERVNAHRVSIDYFAALGAQPMMGRAFTQEEDAVGDESRVALLGHGLWQRRFAADPDILGKEIILDDAASTVIGVMPPGHLWIDELDLFVPLRPGTNTNRGDHRLAIIGRLRDGLSPQQAETDLDAIAARLAMEYPEDNRGFDTRLMPLYDSIVPTEVRQALYILLGAVSLVLLIACANLSNLLLARATSRSREIAVYVALGASRGRVLRQFLTEAALLSTIGAATGTLLAFQVVAWFRAVDPARVPRFDTLQIDASVLLFTLGVALFTGLLAGIVPAWQAAASDPQEALKEGGRGASGSRRTQRTRQLLLVAEVALSIVLLAGAGLLMRSFWQVQSIDPGFRTDNVLSLAIFNPVESMEDFERIPQEYRELLEAIEAIPGVEQAGGTTGLPFGGGDTSMDFFRADADPDPDGGVPAAGWRLITPGYFETLGMPLVRGRWFDPSDGEEAQHHVVITQSMAKQHWPGEDPLGKRFLAWRDPKRVKTIIGVVGDIRERSLETEARHIVYMPFMQNPGWANMFIVVRAAGDPSSVAADVRTTTGRLLPGKPVSDMRPMAAVLDDTMAARRFNTVLLFLFATVALVLAAVGVYGVMAYSVEQRTPEIGIRMAMGAGAPQVLGMVVRQGMRGVLAGVVVGTLTALVTTRLMASLLYGIEPLDPLSLGVAILFLVAVALLACAFPALRATRVDPVEALREA